MKKTILLISIFFIWKVNFSQDTWTQIIGDGFGSVNTTGINELHVFKNQIYAGTQSAGGTGSFQIWKSSTGNAGSWTKITSFTPALTPADASLISMSHTDFGGGILYCGDVNVLQGGAIYRTTNGTSFTKISKRGMGSTNAAITPNMVVFKGTAADTFLYSGVGNTASSSGAASVWRIKYSSTDSNAWVKVIDFKTGLGIGTADTSVTLPTYFYIWNNKIYAACLAPNAGAALFRSDDGTTWTAITTNGFGSAANRAVASIADYKNFLYVTTTNSATGGQLWRSSDGINFSQITGNAFGKGNLVDELHNIRVANGWLWASGLWLSGTQQPTIVWRSSDGTNWVQSNTDGFGNANNNGGGPIFTQFNSNVYCGMRDSVTGAQLWRTNVGMPMPCVDTWESDTVMVFCVGDTITFTNCSQTALNYEWYKNGVLLDTTTNLTLIFDSAAVDTIRLVAINNNLRDSIEALVTVNVCTGIEQLAVDNLQFTIFPNPFTHQTQIKYTLAADLPAGRQGSQIKIEIYNVLGQKIKTIADEKQRSGEHQVIFNGENLAGGIYLLKIKINESIFTQKLIQLK